MTGDSTLSANASLRRGARLSAAVMIPLWIAAALIMLSRGFRTFELAESQSLLQPHVRLIDARCTWGRPRPPASRCPVTCVLIALAA